MSSRRTHTKSRTGCLNCTPSIDGGGDTPSARLPNLTPAPSGSSPDRTICFSHPSPSDQIAPFPPQELWTRDCELMHHYCTVTADSLSIRKDLTYVWAVAIPRLGYRDPFVMHGILAIAAAHKAYLVPASRRIYLQLADYHQTLGSEGYRRQLQNFDLSNWMPVFGFASVVVLHMLTLPMRMEHRILEEPITNLIELAALLRGIRTTLEPVLGRIVKTEFAPVVHGTWVLDFDHDSEPFPSLENSALPTDTWDALRSLRAFQEASMQTDDLEHYTKAIGALEISARLFAAAGLYTEAGAVSFWLYTVNDSVLLDFAAHKPHALLLFAYFLVHNASLARCFWYMRGWAPQTMVKIEEGLAGQPKFLEMLEWPKQRIAEAIV
ncbi:hypothetical protein F66182_2122 [Fusarium sp. NRRL 66182]|nr:hypothetical protein F66182_2122 [Fusarium sp. NRRL 66182]